MSAYYNENNPQAAAWLEELIRAGCIADGVVDTQSIEDIEPADLDEFTQCHFFAGIGGWSYALRLAGWPTDQPIWTGSCPCQPFSTAGKRDGFTDERHLWPAWLWLIQQHRPALIIGEQVASALDWYDLVSRDLEGEGYACGAAIVGAHSVGAPHLRQRLYWVAEPQEQQQHRSGNERGRGRESSDGSGMGYASGAGLSEQRSKSRTSCAQTATIARKTTKRTDASTCGVANSHSPRKQPPIHRIQLRWIAENRFETGWNGPLDGSWSGAEWLWCADNKYRPVEPGTQQMVDGVSRAVGRLRDLGHAEKEALNAAACGRFRDEIMCALRGGVQPEAIWQAIGRRLGFPSALLLLADLCEHERELGRVFHGASSRSPEDLEAYMRALRKGRTLACPSSRWELSEQLAEELGDAVPLLSQTGAPLAGFTGGPLAHGVPARVGRLRGYGNAIVPQAAAAFINSVLEEP